MTRTLSLAVVAVAVAAAVLLVVAEAGPQSQPAFTLGNGDISQYFRDPHQVRRQINCIKGVAGCDQLGRQLKTAIPEVLVRKCARCTPTQARNARKLVDFIERNYPSDYRDIMAMYVH